MQALHFRIGDVFPANDPVARFVTVIAMMSNDWLRLMSLMRDADRDGGDDADGMRVLSFRHQAALYHEAAKFLCESRRRFPEVDTFIQGLDPTTQDAWACVAGAYDPKSAHFVGEWLANHRNLTFHYPRMQPDAAAHGAEELSEALSLAAETNGAVLEGATLADLRFQFADEVVMRWMPPDGEGAVRALVSGVTKLGQFAWAAVEAYLKPYGGTGVLQRASEA